LVFSSLSTAVIMGLPGLINGS